MSGRMVAGAAALMMTLGHALGSVALAQPDSAKTPFDDMVASERAFSALSVDKGMRDAFVEYLADDGIIFRPLPMVGKPVWKARPPSPSTLIWEPSHAEIAAAGDLGWTTGPWEFRPPADSTGAPPPSDQIRHGHFTSMWAKQPDGSWRVALDLGVSHGKPERGVGSGDFAPGPVHSWAATVHKGPKNRADLMAVDRLYARDAKKLGSAAALEQWATADVRFNREGEMPYEGREAAAAALKSAPGLVRLMPQGMRVSSSDDLGYSYGIAEHTASGSAAPDSIVYVHIWRKEADRKWRIASIVENPVGNK